MTTLKAETVKEREMGGGGMEMGGMEESAGERKGERERERERAIRYMRKANCIRMNALKAKIVRKRESESERERARERAIKRASEREEHARVRN